MEWKSLSQRCPRVWRFHFFEGDDNIVCLHWQRQTTLSLHVYPKHVLADTVSARERESSRKDFTRHLGFLLGESTSAQAVARLFPLTVFAYHFKEVRPCLSIACFVPLTLYTALLNESKRRGALQICGWFSGLRLLSDVPAWLRQ